MRPLHTQERAAGVAWVASGSVVSSRRMLSTRSSFVRSVARAAALSRGPSHGGPCRGSRAHRRPQPPAGALPSAPSPSPSPSAPPSRGWPHHSQMFRCGTASRAVHSDGDLQQSEADPADEPEGLVGQLKEMNASPREGQQAAEPTGTVLPPATFTKVKQAEFIKSSVQLDQCPREELKIPEFAVIGRSNVGKSSLINLLTGVDGLAMISKTPGKTTCINHFLINKDLGHKGAWYLVDLPGYGYAKRAKTSRLEWNQFTRDYFLNRKSLANVLLLVDSSIPPTQIDLDCADWLAQSQVPFAIVFTKSDKRKKKTPRPEQNIQAFQDELLQTWEYLPPVLTTSAATGAGKSELVQYLAQLREFFKSNH